MVRPSSSEFIVSTTAWVNESNGFGWFDKDIVRKMNDLATGGLKPDRTIILDMEAREGLRRATRSRKKDRMERKRVSYHDRVRAGYRDIARREPRRVKLIRTQRERLRTHELIMREIVPLLPRKKSDSA